MKAASPRSETIDKLAGLREFLDGRIVGQKEVLSAVVEALTIGELGLTDERRPKSSFLFLGPTGVGKTETVLAFTNYLLGEDQLVRLDMSEYKTRDALTTLLGGGEHQGILEARHEAVNGSGTLLFDEIEKAHREVLDILLQILDAGRLTTGNGQVLDFSGFYVVLTSNIASQTLLTLKRSNRASRVRYVETQAQQQLRPETFARLNRVLVFNALGYEEQVEVARVLLDRERQLQHGHGYAFEVDDQVLRFLTKAGYHSRLGARPMRDAVERFVRKALSDDLMKGGSGCGKLHATGDKLALKRT